MRPIDTPTRDWYLYFNQTYMLHKRVPAHCRVNTVGLYPVIQVEDEQGGWTKVNEGDLDLWWPARS